MIPLSLSHWRWLPLCATLLAIMFAACDSPAPEPATPSACDERMVQIGASCVDRYEAVISNESGRPTAIAPDGSLPTEGASFDQANEACRNAGYRLCTSEEWHRACAGESDRAFPYGDSFEEGRCNVAPDATDVSDRRLAPAGSFERCVTPEGIYDLSGNLGEWIDQAGPSSDLRELRGGAFANYPRFAACRYQHPAFQPRDAEFSGQGFRCCADSRQ